MILADTDVLIDYLTGVQPAEDQVRKYIQSDSLQTGAITCLELLSGARADRRGAKTCDFVEAVPVLSLDRESAGRAAAVRQEWERAGLAIGMADSLIAGIALTDGLPLLTRNRKHFEKIVKLEFALTWQICQLKPLGAESYVYITFLSPLTILPTV